MNPHPLSRRAHPARHWRRSLGAASLTALALTSPGVATVASASPYRVANATASCAAGATPITMWGWAAGYNLAVAEFNRTHPKICVTLDNDGATTAEYTKIQDAVKAGTGAPDVAEIEYFAIPSFEVTHSLANLVPYGVNAYQKDVVPVAWSQVAQGSGVYAMPVDVGPLVFYYNSALFSKYKLTPPATWAQFATEAAKLKSADPGAYLATLDWTDPQPVLAMMQQDDAFPFKYTGGSKLGIEFTGAAAMRFASYWQSLISAKEVNEELDFSPAQWAAWDSGTDLARFSPAWGPVGMQLSIKKTIGDWRAVSMPQSTAGGQLSGNWGGSTMAVLASSKHPQQAAEFAEWFGGTAASWKILSGPIAGAFPGYKPLLDSSSFQAETLPISGPQHFRAIFAQAAQHMIAPQWPPIMSYASTVWPTVFSSVANGSKTLPQAFRTMQSDLVTYAKSQGFSVYQ